MPGDPTTVLSAAERKLLLAVAERIVPEIGGMPPAEREAIAATIDDAIAARPKALRVQFRVFLRLLKWLPALRHGAPLDRLPPETRDRVLRAFQGSPVARLRLGVWGIKTLVFMGYYGRPEVGAAIGYVPIRDGNEALRG
jgi:hypothetical protein